MSDARLHPLPFKHDFGVLPAPELVCKTPVSLVNICTTYGTHHLVRLSPAADEVKKPHRHWQGLWLRIG